MVAIVPGQGEKSAGEEVNNEIAEVLSRRLTDIC